MNILSIESSCDETAAAIVCDGSKILSNVVVSQVDIFKAYGGVIPEVAARSHLEAILPVVHQALDIAFPNLPEDSQWSQVDAISVTHTPGLLGSLLIGTLTARTLAILHDKPFYPVHHLKSHIYATWLDQSTEPQLDQSSEKDRKAIKGESRVTSFSSGFDASASSETEAPRAAGVGCPHPSEPRLEWPSEKDRYPTFPLLALVVSGGHTQIIRMTKHNAFEIIGTTRDDAVGECFDKVAKILGLPYPGGPSIAQAATTGNPHKYHLPHPKVPNLDFSFSGLKTAVLRTVQSELKKPISFPSHQLAPLLSPQQVADFAASFQQTAINILLEKLQTALSFFPDAQSIVIAGGVSANQLLRQESSKLPVKVYFPGQSFSGDNAAMVSAATFYEIQSGIQPSSPYSLNLFPRSDIH